MNNWIQVSGSALQHNFQVLQQAAGRETEVLAVVKANAYGHGAERCAATLVQAGARWLGVTCASEGVRVRAAAGSSAEILVMCGFLPEDVASIREHRLTPVLWTEEQVGWLAGCDGLRVHVEVDTGMARQGALPGAELAALLGAVGLAGLEVDGLFTHFSASEEVPEKSTFRQQTLFAEAVEQAHAAGVRLRWVHAGNSSTLDNPAERARADAPWLVSLAASVGARAMVRSGLALYGHCLPTSQSHVHAKLRPALEWRARVLAVRALAVGETVGYSSTFTATAPMRVALLPVGYADGLRRELSGPHGWVMIAGKRASILGRISMNLTVVDVTELAGILPGEEAVLLGPGVTAEDHARLAGTIAYEILCGIHPCG